MTRIAAVHGALAPHRYAQAEITDMVARACLPEGADRGLLDRLHRNAGVRTRHMTLPLDRYETLDGFGAANDLFVTTATDLGARVVREALRAAGLSAADVDLLVFTSVTGVAVPSVDARVAGRLGLRPDVRRVPLFGLGCAGGAAGLARTHDLLLGRPDQVGVLLSVELCSLTFQRGDDSTANLVATGLFGDGATAVVVTGAGRAGDFTGPVIVDARSRLYPDAADALGWDIGDSGFKVVLDPGIPDVLRRHLADDVEEFLADHGLKAQDVTAWVCHPGGPRILDAIADALTLPAEELALSRAHLAGTGNLSSSSLLHVLRDTLTDRRPPPGTPGLLLAVGPGLACESVLLRW
ncbi:3-oxoacyl-[acyl-carrier-protein] synthase III C-terminal domain-containing protein [Streptomyces sp. NPDC046860]|uniref:type III polyketide synthase n=1 Tax=Streptomyces sp. NPDC046860 TaxID=3154495 RepID=UPI0033EC5157